MGDNELNTFPSSEVKSVLNEPELEFIFKECACMQSQHLGTDFHMRIRCSSSGLHVRCTFPLVAFSSIRFLKIE